MTEFTPDTMPSIIAAKKRAPSRRLSRAGTLHLGRRTLRSAAVIGSLALGCLTGRAMPSAPAGVIETGAPAFVVLGPEALGLSTAPINLHLLPDGRILVASQQELSFGDGVRWTAFRAAEGDPAAFSSIAVDTDGRLYMGFRAGFVRIDLMTGSRWNLTPVAELPAEAAGQNAALVYVETFSDHWYWHGGNGAIVSWRPGQNPRVVGNRGAIELIFNLDGENFLSDESSGGLYRLKDGGLIEQVQAAELLVSETVTCATPFGPGQLLVGTGSAGLRLFDGKSFLPFGESGVLGKGNRITDVTPAGEGYFAASVDSVGIIFFDREGHPVQVLDRSLDHRLARVKRLEYSPAGVLWGMLNDGLVRVEFPSPVSQFEPLLSRGLKFAQPVRHAGELWVLADGQSMRGVYDDHGLLERFVESTPTGRFLFTLNEVDGQLFASNEEGIHVHDGSGWRLILPGIVNARIGVAPSSKDGMFYVARGEYGTIMKSGANYTALRIMVPELGDSYGHMVDAAGIGWIELGMSLVGRFDPHGEEPALKIFGTDDGIVAGWVEIYVLDGIARFHAAYQLARFDDGLQRFVEDRELLARFPQLAEAGGRPVTDHLGRMWYTGDGTAQLIDCTPAGGDRRIKTKPVGFAPGSYTMEDNGVVWMFMRGRLARMDLRVPLPPEPPLQALITSVLFSTSGRQIFAPDSALEPIDYADNSVVIHFAAPANPFAAPVTFEVLLEGAGDQWVSTGAVGSATFNRLKEGKYVFRVRPVSGGTTPGTEARVQFTVRPPWFRTPVAWVVYSAGTVGLFVFVIWLSSFLQRHENERLERVVAQRTAELSATNAMLGRQIEETMEKSAALSVSEERVRLLNADLERRVAERTAKLAEASGLLDAMLDNSPDLIYFKDRDSRFVRFSKAFGARFQLSDPEVIRGKTDFDFFDIRHAQPAFDDEQEIMRTGEPIIGKLEEESYADGHLTWVLTTKMPWRDGNGAIIGTFGISKDVTAWKETEIKLAATHELLLKTSRQAGMAEVATGVLHNVGNVLNSVNVSAGVLRDTLRASEVPTLTRVAAMLRDHEGDIDEFLTTSPKGRMLPKAVMQLADQLEKEHAMLNAEQEHLIRNVEHIKSIVAMQQNYATVSGIREKVRLADLLRDVLQMHAVSFARHGIKVIPEYEDLPEMILDRHKVVQILVNLASNARQAIDETERRSGHIHVSLKRAGADRVKVSFADDGVGIPAENFIRVFSHGFTTRQDGHGFGLHSGALAAREMGGVLTVESAGAGMGATFTLELPIETAGPQG